MPAVKKDDITWLRHLGGHLGDPGSVVIGMAVITGGNHPDLIVRQGDGSVAVVEADGSGAVRRYVCADCFDGASIIGAADVTGNGHADLIGVAANGDLLLFPHTGVFWPQDPAATFGCPEVIGSD